MARIHRRTIQNDLHDSDNHDGVLTHLEPDILESEVKWTLIRRVYSGCCKNHAKKQKAYLAIGGQEGNIRTEMSETNS